MRLAATVDKREEHDSSPNGSPELKGAYVPYSNMVAEILEGIPRRNERTCFPCRIPTTTDFRLEQIQEELDDDVPNWTLHDFRRTYRTFMDKSVRRLKLRNDHHHAQAFRRSGSDLTIGGLISLK